MSLNRWMNLVLEDGPMLEKPVDPNSSAMLRTGYIIEKKDTYNQRW